MSHVGHCRSFCRIFVSPATELVALGVMMRWPTTYSGLDSGLVGFQSGQIANDVDTGVLL